MARLIVSSATLRPNKRRRSWSRRFVSHKIGVVYVPYVDRPFDKGILKDGNLADEFVWRRTHNEPFHRQVIWNIIKDTFATNGFEIASVTYDKYAGCSTCPCSPGYVVKGVPLHEYDYRFNSHLVVFLSHKEEETP